MRFEKLKSWDLVSGSVIDWDILKQYKLEDRAREYIGENTPWSRLYDHAITAHREITIEFLCTFIYRQKDDEEQDNDGDADEVEFCLFGQRYKMSLETFAAHCGLYTDAETVTDDFQQALKEGPDDEMKNFWAAIAPEKPPFGENYKGVQERASRIKDPLYRYIHRLNSKTITARSEDGEWVSLTDLLLLYCILKKVPCNLAHILVVYYHGFHHRKESRNILCGHLITRIAQSLGLKSQLATVRIRGVSPIMIGGKTMKAMGILANFDGKVSLAYENHTKPWTGPDPLDLPAPLPTVEIDQVHEEGQPDMGAHHGGPQVPVRPRRSGSPAPCGDYTSDRADIVPDQRYGGGDAHHAGAGRPHASKVVRSDGRWCSGDTFFYFAS